MQDLFRRLAGGRPVPRDEPPAPATSGERDVRQAVPGAPFSRDELPALLGERPGLAEFVAGRSDAVSEEFGVLPLVEAGVWLTLLGDGDRAARAFRAAAGALQPQAALDAADALALARRESLPVEAGVKAGAFLALAGEPGEAERVWRRCVSLYEPLAGAAGAAGAAEETADRVWRAWQARVGEIERGGPDAARAPEDEPLDPATLGRVCVYLAYARLRRGEPDPAGTLLDVEAALRAAAPDAKLKRYYGDLLFLVDSLAGVLRGIVAQPAGGGARSLETAVRAFLKTRHPEAQALTLDLQRAFPERVPVLLPPADLTEALSARARKRLEEARR